MTTRVARPRGGTEGDLVRAVVQLINARGGLATRMNSGRTVIRSGGKTRAIHMAGKGWPDVIGVLPYRKTLVRLSGETWTQYWPEELGRMVAIECKRPGNKPTREQEAMLAELRKRGALVVVAFDIKDVEKALTP